MSQAAAKTGAGPTTVVAMEQTFAQNQRIIDDKLAFGILPAGLRALLWLMRPRALRDWMIRAAEKSSPGIWGGVLCRKRYIDEKVDESMSFIEAVVNLGAGFDTRALRLQKLSSTAVFELDQSENIEAKKAGLLRLFGAVPAHITLVPIDFDREELSAVLASRGYASNKRTFFIWEAVTQYLTEAGVRSTFDFLAKAKSESRLAFSYIRKDFLDGRVLYGQEALYRRYVAKNRIWCFGMEPDGVADFLGEYGWRVVEHLGYDELAERYMKPTGRGLVSTPIERMVYAEKI